jgi:hypothetical protein
MRDLGQVLEHDTPLHIEQGWRKKRAAIAAALSAKPSQAGPGDDALAGSGLGGFDAYK